MIIQHRPQSTSLTFIACMSNIYSHILWNDVQIGCHSFTQLSQIRFFASDKNKLKKFCFAIAWKE
jgi:hypothetical protein